MQSIRVLLIDDDNNYFTLVRRMLADDQQTYVVEWAGSYAEGLEAMLKHQHDIYLVDYFLEANSEHESGIDLLNKALSEGVTAPVIIMTGLEKDNLDVHSLQAGAAEYIDKIDLNPESLRRTLRYARERAYATQALRESEERYRSLVEDAFEAIIITDETGKIASANRRSVEMLGYSQNQLAEKNIKDLYNKFDPAKDLPQGTQGILAERQFKRVDNGLLDVEVSAKSVSGKRIQYIFRDITSRKQAAGERDRYIQQLTILGQIDDELSQIMNIDHVLSLAIDAAMRLSGANAGFIGMMENGQLELAQAIGHYASMLDDKKLPDMPLVKALIKDEEARLIQDVSKEPAYVTLNPQTKAQMLLPMKSYERMVGILNLETNLPERFTKEAFDFLKLIAARVAVAVENAQLYKIAQDQLAELQELYAQVKELEQIKTDMIRIAAHDLRNPVSVIVGYTELLRKFIGQPDTSKQENFLNMIERAALRMEKITTDILSLERIENLQSDPGRILSMNDLVTETYKEFESQAKDKSQEYILDLPKDTIHVQADSAQLHEAIANLIGNAIKYTPAQGNVTVRIEKTDDNAIFKVVDSGFGIPESQQVSLFQPFFRAASKETMDIEGTGLGLYLIKNIVERYHGKIVFKSVYGQGSTFGFQLPLQVQEVKEDVKEIAVQEAAKKR